MNRNLIVVVILVLLWSLFSSAEKGNNLISTQNIAVKAIFIDDNGNKWFGTNNGLFLFDGNNWTQYSSNDYLADSYVNSLTFEQSFYGPELWVATKAGVSVVAYDIDGVTGATSYTSDDGVFGDKIADVVVDSRNNKIFGSDDGITFFQNGTMVFITYDDYQTSLLNKPINDMAIHNDSIYVAFDGGIGRLVSDEVDGITGASRWTSEYGITPLSGNIKAIEIDSNGNQWFGTDAGAEKHVGHRAKENWTLYTEDEGLVDNMVISIREDNNGAIWFGTHGGVSKFLNDNWTSFTTDDGLASDTVYDIAFEEDGTVWFATHKGISKMTGTEISGLDIIVGINDPVIISASNPKVYMNNQNQLFIDFDKSVNEYLNISIFDSSGKLIISESNKVTGKRIELKLKTFYRSGIYFIVGTGNNGIMFSSKLLILE